MGGPGGGGGGGGGGGLRLTLDEQDHPLEKAITIMSPSYLGNTTVAAFLYVA